ncbi:DUF6629 family protein [Streptomyces sp. V4-01]|uniref:DUF6629 family protein n=1 Tax=Actinacidiphila polyblastidii TaxID=3110430 RepID=A0ABU7PES8_9ACTN|nr:DUF6629 family protein [Streptomyces sp. V4-01]
MCWSATADLAAGAVVTALGAGCLARVRRPRELPLAALPVLLGAHQLIEAAVWRQGGGTGPAVTAWTVVAMPLLAAWVPLAVLAAAPPRARARAAVPAALGVATAAVLAVSLAARAPAADIRGHTVGYAVRVPYPPLVVAGYLLATVGALLLSADPLLRLLGALTAAGAVLCAALWRLEFVSTWCALAAVASLVLLARAWRPAPA